MIPAPEEFHGLQHHLRHQDKGATRPGEKRNRDLRQRNHFEEEQYSHDRALRNRAAIEAHQLASAEERACIDADHIKKHEIRQQAMKSEPDRLKPKLEQDVKSAISNDVTPKLEQTMKPKIEPGIATQTPIKTEPKSTPKAIPKPEPDDSKDELAALDALESEAKEFNKVRQTIPPLTPSPNPKLTHPHQDAEIDRILKAFKLDAYAPTPSPPLPRLTNSHSSSYAVLDLQPGVPESDIKLTYRKKSLLIHPDKTTNPLAPEAFDRLKKAQTELMDEKARARLDECIADARMLLMRERKLTVDSEEMRAMDAQLREAWRRKTVEVLVDSEHRRRKQLKAQMQEEGREQRRVDEEVEVRKRKREHEVAWEESREGRIGSWRDFQGKAGAEKEAGKKKKGKLKVLG